jgi:hypothetical protein
MAPGFIIHFRLESMSLLQSLGAATAGRALISSNNRLRLGSFD